MSIAKRGSQVPHALHRLSVVIGLAVVWGNAWVDRHAPTMISRWAIFGAATIETWNIAGPAARQSPAGEGVVGFPVGCVLFAL